MKGARRLDKGGQIVYTTAGIQLLKGGSFTVANTKSAMKMIRVAARRRARNAPVRQSLKTRIKRSVQEIVAKKPTAATSVVTSISALDKAAERGIIHKNNASRRKSRLMRKLNKMAAG